MILFLLTNYMEKPKVTLKKETVALKYAKRLDSTEDFTSNKIRSNTLNQLRKFIQDEKLITEIENEILKVSVQEFKKPQDFSDNKFVNIYAHHAINVVQNLDNESYAYSEEALTSIKDKVSIRPEHLKPSKWNEHKERMNLIAEETLYSVEETTNIYYCSKCKKRNCTYITVQTRSADEGYTTIISCKTPGCGSSWRINA